MSSEIDEGILCDHGALDVFSAQHVNAVLTRPIVNCYLLANTLRIIRQQHSRKGAFF